jgi:hypothetical protein
MGGGRIEWAKHLVEVWNAAEFETWLDEVGPEFAFTPDPSFPDAGTYRGEEFRSWMRGMDLDLEGEPLRAARGRGGRGRHAAPGPLAPGDSADRRGGPLQDFTLVLFYEDEGAERPDRMAAFFDPQPAREAAEAGTG